jgi:hypothetical protein
MTRILFAPFSDCRLGVIRALLVEHGRLAVTLFLEQDNRADPHAVAVVSSLPPFVVGGQAVFSGPERVGQRIGYIARAEAAKRDLAALLAQQDEPLAANLVLSGADWWIELQADPDDLDKEVPY